MWETLIRNVNEGFLMGCSKHNESVDGEQTTKMGLVYNHAYGILRCEEFKGVRLICLSACQSNLGLLIISID
jgi:hypothetical protein